MICKSCSTSRIEPMMRSSLRLGTIPCIGLMMQLGAASGYLVHRAKWCNSYGALFCAPESTWLVEAIL